MTASEKLAAAVRIAKDTTLGYAVWYVGLALAAWLLLYVLLVNVMRQRKISGKLPKRGQIPRELWHSLRSILIYSIVTVFVVYAAYSGWTQFYRPADRFGWTWYAISLALMIAMHDTYFYWTHRAMHHPRLFRLFHRTHHLSIDPTPWAAYAFSPWEAVVQAGIGPLIVFTIPCHPTAFALFMVWQISFNVFGHNGYELYPRWFLKSPLGFVMNTATHHALHHEKVAGNYSLYFNVWDRLMGTNRPEYEQRFAQAAGGIVPVGHESDVPAHRINEIETHRELQANS